MKTVEVWKTFKGRNIALKDVLTEVKRVAVYLFGDRALKTFMPILDEEGWCGVDYGVIITRENMPEKYGFIVEYYPADGLLTVFVSHIK